MKLPSLSTDTNISTCCHVDRLNLKHLAMLLVFFSRDLPLRLNSTFIALDFILAELLKDDAII